MSGRRFTRRPPAAGTPAPAPGVVTPVARPGDGLRALQQSHGNQAVQALVQARAATGAPGDRWEREADRVAHQVAGPATGLDDLRARTEQATGADLSAARLHRDARADALNRDAGSLALTRGADVWFRGGRYSPDTTAGRELIAHELTHVAQQGAGGGAPATQHSFGDVQRALGVKWDPHKKIPKATIAKATTREGIRASDQLQTVVDAWKHAKRAGFKIHDEDLAYYLEGVKAGHADWDALETASEKWLNRYTDAEARPLKSHFDLVAALYHAASGKHYAGRRAPRRRASRRGSDHIHFDDASE